MQHEIPNISSAVTPNIRRMSPVNGLSRIVFSQPNSSNFDQFSASPTPLSMTSADSTTTAMIAVAYLSQLMSRHKDLMNRFCSCALQLKNTIHEVKTLQLENVNLRIANRELSHQISVLLKAAELQTAAAAVAAAAARSETQQLAGVGQSSSEKSTSMSPTSETVNETGRVSLPKSISVRSSDYLKLKSSGADDSSGSSSEAKPKPKRASSSKTHVLSPLSVSQKVRVGGGSKNDGPIELEVFNHGMFKTELCNKWQDTGNCPYGDHCQFAHGIKELRPVIRHPRYKTEVCRMVLSGDPCPYGHRCHFRHALTPEEKLLLSTDTEAADSSEAETADSTDTAPIV